MNYHDMTLAVFERKPLPHLLFQPRIESWFRWHTLQNDLPQRYRAMRTVAELYDDLNVSWRYAFYSTDLPFPVETQYSESVRFELTAEHSIRTRTWHTPYGDLTELQERASDSPVAGWQTTVHALRDFDDIKRLTWLYENTSFRISPEKYALNRAAIGSRGVPQFYLPRSPLQALCVEWSRLDECIYLLHDFPAEMEALMKTIDDSYDSLYHSLVTERTASVLNFGENVDARLVSPRYFETFNVPFYHRRAGFLRSNGIFTHIHIDGDYRPLLRYFRDLPFDGFESLTFTPMGDVTPEETKEYCGDKIIIDGIPAILFLDDYPEQEFQSYVRNIISIFQPNLILGISGELPQNADAGAIERVRWVSELCRDDPTQS